MIIYQLIFEEEGQGLVEYGIILGLIALVVVASLTAMGQQVDRILSPTSNTISQAENTIKSNQ